MVIQWKKKRYFGFYSQINSVKILGGELSSFFLILLFKIFAMLLLNNSDSF